MVLSWTLVGVPMNDQKTLDLFCNGQTVAVFQFESSGMTDYLRKLKPTSIHDLVAMNALYRPGPMENIPEFIERKHRRGRSSTFIRNSNRC